MRRHLAALLVLVAACGSDGPPTYEYQGETNRIVCDDPDLFVDQYVRYEASEVVFTRWYDECGDDWLVDATRASP